MVKFFLKILIEYFQISPSHIQVQSHYPRDIQGVAQAPAGTAQNRDTVEIWQIESTDKQIIQNCANTLLP